MNLHLSLLTNTVIYLESPVCCCYSFIAIEIYICMTSMMIVEITMEVSVNTDLPLKGRAQAWGLYAWALTLRNFRHILDLVEL